MMDSITQANWENLRTHDGDLRFAALNSVVAATDQPADWAYDMWDSLTDFQTRSPALSIPGLAERFEPDNPVMHTTDTNDYGIVLDGEIWLELDDGRVQHLRQHDIVIQNGTRHAWRNKSDRPALMASSPGRENSGSHAHLPWCASAR